LTGVTATFFCFPFIEDSRIFFRKKSTRKLSHHSSSYHIIALPMLTHFSIAAGFLLSISSIRGETRNHTNSKHKKSNMPGTQIMLQSFGNGEPVSMISIRSMND
jgi:hypothetical protein